MKKPVGLIVIICFIAVLTLFFGILWATNQNSTIGKTLVPVLFFYSAISLIGAVTGLSIRIIKDNRQKSTDEAAYKPYTQTVSSATKDIPPELDIVIPLKESISGSFVCSSCGATTTINKEVYPRTDCKFCGAPLLDLQTIIQSRDAYYQESYNKEIEHKRRLREEYEERETKLRELNKQEEIENHRIFLENQQKLLMQERQEKEREKEHQRTMAIIETIIISIIVVILIIIISSLLRRR